MINSIDLARDTWAVERAAVIERILEALVADGKALTSMHIESHQPIPGKPIVVDVCCGDILVARVTSDPKMTMRGITLITRVLPYPKGRPAGWPEITIK